MPYVSKLKNVLIIVSILYITGCSASLDTKMQSWVGEEESKLLSTAGAPDTAIDTNDGKKVLTWKNMWTDNRGNIHTCRRSFTISENGKVEKWSYSDC